MAAHESLGEQFHVYHGTPGRWKGAPQASYDQPFHVSTSNRLAASYTDPNRGYVKKYAVSPDAVIHHDEGVSYASGGNTDEAVERARAAGADATLHKDSVMQVYNPKALIHVEDRKIS